MKRFSQTLPVLVISKGERERKSRRENKRTETGKRTGTHKFPFYFGARILEQATYCLPSVYAFTGYASKL